MSVTLSFKVEKDHLIRCDKEKITDKTRNYILLSFSSFSEDWTDLNVFLILQDEAKNNYLFDLNEEEPTVTVPEVVLRGGLFKVSVVGFNDNTRITTNRRTIPLFPSGYTTNHIRPVEPGDYSTDVFEDFILRLTNYVQKSSTNGLLKNDGSVDTTEYSTFSGSYEDLSNKPTIPTIPTNISAFNNDVGYLTQHQSLSNYVQKSSTTGLIKNDGTVDTTSYLSSLPSHTHDDRYYTESEMDTLLGGKSDTNHTHSNYVNPTIADNLTTNDSTQVLSAKQGKVLNDLIGNAISYING